MDSTIDPSISEQVFHVPTSPIDNSQKNDAITIPDREELPNVFRLNDYVAEHHDQSQLLHDQHGGEVNATAAAALNMINYGFDNDIPSDASHSHEHHIDLVQHHNINQYGAMGLPFDPLHHSHQPQQHHSQQIPIPQQLPISRMHVVPYSPNEKPKRLGRPRRHIHNHTIPEDNSIQNVNESMVSKFRFDFLPIQGPGSRGGKLGGRRSPRGRVPLGNSMNAGLGPIDDNAILSNEGGRRTRRKKADSPDAGETKNNTFNDIEIEVNIEHQTTKEDVPLVAEVISNPVSASEIQNHSKTAKMKANEISTRILKEQAKQPRKIAMFASAPSRTTIFTTKSKMIKLLPGPLIALNSTLYDDNIMQAKENQKKATEEKLAFGYPVLVAPYAKDITMIIMFLNKYKLIVFGKEVYYIGPHDFEIGLSLPRYFQEDNRSHSDQFITYRTKEDNEPYDTNFISPLMTILFCRLLALVLNKKKEILSSSQKAAIGELKSQVVNLGLPSEWLDSSLILVKPLISEDDGNGASVDEKYTPVDTKNPEIFEGENDVYEEPTVLYNPFRDAEFEKNGLRALSPENRLIMLRTLVQWSMSNCNTLKAYINDNSNHQDIGGERSTYYVARSIMKGFKNAEDASKEAELKLSKRNANKKASSVETNESKAEESESGAKYVDPLSDPLSHPLSWRLDELCIGDIGFNVGRFYLCRTADADGGGLSSLRKMKAVYTNFRELKDIPSSFKLYVEDVHQVLVEDLTKYGIEFDENGNEVESDFPFNAPSSNWYEVAGNASELKSFVEYLSEKLKLLPSSLHKQTTNLVTFLSFIEPLIANQESAMIGVTTQKTTRKREEVNYNDVTNSRRLVDEESEPEEYVDDIEDVDMDDEDYQE